MEIYNRKKFISGVISLTLVVMLLVLTLLNINSGSIAKDIKHIIFVVILLAVGITDIYRSLNKKYTKEDIIEENDERNQMINIKTRSKAFLIILAISYILTLGAAILFSFTKSTFVMGMVVGIGIMPATMIIVWIIVYIYYEKHN